MDYFTTNSLGINMFSIVYMIFYFPASILSIFVTERFGVGVAIVLGAMANFLCCWIRYAGSLQQQDDPMKAYQIVLFGQILAAIGQPMLLNAPSRIANDWFPIGERDIVMHVMTQANNIGGAMGCLIPAYQVFQFSDFSDILRNQSIAGTIILVLSFLFIRKRPITPPGVEVEKQILIRSELDTEKVIQLIIQMFKDFRTMLQNKNFVLLLLSFSFEIGVAWAFMAVVGQMIGPCGYDTYVIGIAGASLSFAGVLGSFTIAFILKIYKNYLVVQKSVMILTSCTVIWCLGVNKPGSIGVLLAAWHAFGFFQGPLIPICLEHAAEITYPIPADNSAALLFTGVNWVCLALTLGLTPLLTYDESMSCSSVISPSSILVFVITVSGALIALPMGHEYHRLDAATPRMSTTSDAGSLEFPKTTAIGLA